MNDTFSVAVPVGELFALQGVAHGPQPIKITIGDKSIELGTYTFAGAQVTADSIANMQFNKVVPPVTTETKSN